MKTNESAQDDRPGSRRRVCVAAVSFLSLLLLAGLAAYGWRGDHQETVLLGQFRWTADDDAGIRILVRDRRTAQPIENARVRVLLESNTRRPVELAATVTDLHGSVDSGLSIPDLPPGSYNLLVETASSRGRDRIQRTIEIVSPAVILLGTDKPVYQPGQTIHLRALARHSRSQQPMAGAAITFEVSDPRGNKVFKETREASRFGIASADFVLAEELNLGRYHIRAFGDMAAMEQTVEVKRHVLPRFKIRIETGRAYYLPGETVSGVVQAEYFFGKPVAEARTTITFATMHEKPVAIGAVSGVTDASGRLEFQFQMPGHFAGMPQLNERAFLDIAATVRDTADHVEEAARMLSVARNHIEIGVFPEAGVWVPRLENRVYILTTYPDGRPAACRIVVNGSAFRADPAGVCVVTVLPAGANDPLRVEAFDDAGRTGTLAFSPESGLTPPLLLRTDKPAYRAGETARLTVHSQNQTGGVFLDVISGGRTVVTKSLSLRNGTARLDLPMPSHLAGAVKLNAYVITAEGEDRGHERLIYVQPASDLDIRVETDREVYRPGETATLKFELTDAEGRPAPGAIGIAAVDEAVFAMHESRPGLLRQFLEAESELLKPAWQIRSFGSPERIFNGESEHLAAAFLAAALPPRAPWTGGDPRAGGPPDRALERLRAARGSPEFEAMRNDPRFAEAISRIDGGRGDYTLWETTGPVKTRVANVRRHQRAARVKAMAAVALFIGLGTIPFTLALVNYYRRINIPRPAASPLRENARRVCLAHFWFCVLALLQIVWLGIMGVTSGHRMIRFAPDWLVAGDALLVAVFGAMLLSLAGRLRHAGEFRIAARIRSIFGLYLFQLTCLRAPFFIEEWISVILPLLVLATPLLPLGVLLISYLSTQSWLRKGALELPRSSFLLPAGLAATLLVLFGGMLLPSLAKAKARAQRVSLASDLRQMEMAARLDGPVTAADDFAAGPRLRQYFPETLFWRPELITDDEGRASLEIPLADSITTWRASIDAVNASGRLGGAELPIRVFQDFFVDIDLPVSLTMGDEVSVPVVCHNYLKSPQEVHLDVSAAGWFELRDGNPRRTVALGPGEVKAVHLPIRVLAAGTHSFRVNAMGHDVADAVQRRVRVTPSGHRIEFTRNEVLRDNHSTVFKVPGNTIPNSATLAVKLYPTRFSEIVEGLDTIFQAPWGCFEQTSSTTYPNVLALDYLKRIGRASPEIEVKARKYINAGYQRLMTFEVAGGGFDWFGNPPANVTLTAYGVLQFSDMSRVHAIDPNVIQRAKAWLFAQQKPDGSWDAGRGSWTWGGRGSVTAFVAWALAESGDRSSHLERALDFLRRHPDEFNSLYGKALAANAFLARDPRNAFGLDLARGLDASAQRPSPETAFWSSIGRGASYGSGKGFDVETTALVAMALMKAGEAPDRVRQALAWISHQKQPSGAWNYTQATILAMRALVLATSAPLGQTHDAEVAVFLNGHPIQTFHITSADSDVMRHASLTEHLQAGDNRLDLRQRPSGELPFQIAGDYWVPDEFGSAKPPRAEPLEIELDYDRTTLAVNDEIDCHVSVRNNTAAPLPMAIIDLGVPPGFDVDAAVFQRLQETGRISKFEVTGTQVILYLRELSHLEPYRFTWTLRAKYPLRVQAPASRVYEYYQPEVRAQTLPATLEVVP